MQPAQFASRCEICLTSHIEVGDLIERTGRGWAAKGCIDAEQRLEGVEPRVEAAMREHGFMFGIALPGSGFETVGTRASFYFKARELGLLSAAEYRDLERARRGLWDWSLTD